MRRLLVLCCLTLQTVPAVAETFQNGDLRVSDAWTRATTRRGNAEGYMTLENSGVDDKLIGASCSGADGTVLSDNNTKLPAMMGLSPMSSELKPILTEIDIPPKGRTVLKPGGLRLTLEDVLDPLKIGDHVACVLQFRNAGPLDVVLQVAKPNATTPPS